MLGHTERWDTGNVNESREKAGGNGEDETVLQRPHPAGKTILNVGNCRDRPRYSQDAGRAWKVKVRTRLGLQGVPVLHRRWGFPKGLELDNTWSGQLDTGRMIITLLLLSRSEYPRRGKYLRTFVIYLKTLESLDQLNELRGYIIRPTVGYPGSNSFVGGRSAQRSLHFGSIGEFSLRSWFGESSRVKNAASVACQITSLIN